MKHDVIGIFLLEDLTCLGFIEGHSYWAQQILVSCCMYNW